MWKRKRNRKTGYINGKKYIHYVCSAFYELSFNLDSFFSLREERNKKFKYYDSWLMSYESEVKPNFLWHSMLFHFYYAY